MDDGQKHRKSPGSPKVVSMLRAKRRFYSMRPATEPPCVVKALKADIPEPDRFLISEADINADIRLGDPGLIALRKCRYVIENASEAFTDPRLLELMLVRTIRIISDYGEPEGAALLREALGLHMDMKAVREEVSRGISQIGDEGELVLLLRLLAVDAASPAVHLDSISAYLERYPAQSKKARDALMRLQSEIPQAAATLEEISRIDKKTE